MISLQLKHKILIVLNASVWALVTLAWHGTVQLSATNMVPVEIVAEPPRVKLVVNGTPWANGAYFTTPTTISLPVGQNKITVQRTGYRSNTSSLLIQSSKDRPKVSTVLESSMDGIREVIIEPLNDSNLDDIEISVDNGLEKGQIPLVINDMVPGTHTLEISTGVWNKRTVQCQFEVPDQLGKDDIKITVERVGKKLRFSGCKKTR